VTYDKFLSVGENVCKMARLVADSGDKRGLGVRVWGGLHKAGFVFVPMSGDKMF